MRTRRLASKYFWHDMNLAIPLCSAHLEALANPRVVRLDPRDLGIIFVVDLSCNMPESFVTGMKVTFDSQRSVVCVLTDAKLARPYKPYNGVLCLFAEELSI